jgi:chromosome segregation ATPase
MNPASKIVQVTETNPRSVLQAIGSTSGFDLNQSTFGTSNADLSADLADATPSDPQSAADVISLRINPDTNPINENCPNSVLESTVESVSQIQQLAARLEATEIELQQREAQLEQRINAWNQTSAEQQSDFEKRIHQLGQQATQVRCQQLHLMQLQTDIVKSHEATRDAIESLVLETGSDKKTLASLSALKHELSGRFDYIARRWEHLAELMHNIRTQIVANEASDDSVDWTGELS